MSMKSTIYIDTPNAVFVEQIQKEQNFTKLSNAINYIIREYRELVENKKQEVDVVDEEQQDGIAINWDAWLE